MAMDYGAQTVDDTQVPMELRLRFSLILATVNNRPRELRRFIDHIPQDFLPVTEVIIVNQAESALNLQTHNSIPPSTITVINSPERGLSVSRNKGLQRANGEILVFPDDDCFYDSKTLALVQSTFDKDQNIDVLLARHVDHRNGKSPHPRLGRKKHIQRNDLVRFGNSITIFVRRNHKTDGISFDERFGAGSVYGSHEETDYLMRLHDNGCQIIYDSEIVVYHELHDYEEWPVRKTFTYAMGGGAAWKKNKIPLREIVYHLFLRPTIGALLGLVQLRPLVFRYRATRALGGISGFVLYSLKR